MNNTEKLLRAFVEASGFDIEEVKEDVFMGRFSGVDQYQNKVTDYKVTKNDASKVDDMVTICEILEKHNMSCMDFVLEVQGSKNENI